MGPTRAIGVVAVFGFLFAPNLSAQALKEKAVLYHSAGDVLCITFSPDGRTLATGNDYGTVWLFDVATRKPTAPFGEHKQAVTCVAFSPSGKVLASGSFDTAIRVCDVATGKTTATLDGHKYGVQSVAFSPDGKLLAS